MRPPALPPLVLLLLAGCYGRIVDAPSLGPRAVERAPVPLPDAAAEPASAASPALAARLGDILVGAEAAHARFETARTAATTARSRAHGAAEGSEAWIAAEEAASARAAARGPVSDAVIALDALRTDPSYAGPADRAAIDAAAARLEGLAAAEAGETPAAEAGPPSGFPDDRS